MHGLELPLEGRQSEVRAAVVLLHLSVESRGIGDFGRASGPHRSLPLGPERLSSSAARPESEAQPGACA